MKRIRQIGVAGFAGILLAVVIVGCEMSDSSSSANSDVSGSWLYSDTGGRQSTWALVQSDDGALSGAGTDGETISGTVSADSIYMSLTYSSSNSTSSLNGTVSASTMTGSFTNSATGSGSWTAVKTN